MKCPYCSVDNDKEFCDLSKPHPIPSKASLKAFSDFQFMIEKALDNVELTDVRTMIRKCRDLNENQKAELLLKADRAPAAQIPS